MPCRVCGDARLYIGAHQRQVRGGEDVAPGVPRWITAGFKLLEVRDLGQVDLGGQVPSRQVPRRSVAPSGCPAATTVPRTAPRRAARAGRPGSRRGSLAQDHPKSTDQGTDRFGCGLWAGQRLMSWHVGMSTLFKVLDHKAKTTAYG